VFRFSLVVEGFKLLIAYDIGDGVWVELDVLLDESTLLPIVYNVAQTI